jgi:hypothetical protein
MIERVPPWWFFVLFMVSGFSRLVYESIWSRYLRVFLGHAAYAVPEGAPGLRTASRNPLPELLKGHLYGAHQGEGI